MNELKKTITWENVKGTQEQIKGYVNNYCNDFNVYYSNLIISNGSVSFTTYSKITYERLVNKLVKEKYSDSEEFALINKGIEDNTNTEYVVYRKYVEECKKIARTFIDERTSVIGR